MVALPARCGKRPQSTVAAALQAIRPVMKAAQTRSIAFGSRHPPRSKRRWRTETAPAQDVWQDIRPRASRTVASASGKTVLSIGEGQGAPRGHGKNQMTLLSAAKPVRRSARQDCSPSTVLSHEERQGDPSVLVFRREDLPSAIDSSISAADFRGDQLPCEARAPSATTRPGSLRATRGRRSRAGHRRARPRRYR